MEQSTDSSVTRVPLLSECTEQPLNQVDLLCESQRMTTGMAVKSSEQSETISQVSASLARWESKISEFQHLASKKRKSPLPVMSGPSPVSSRTRTSLKRSSSLSLDEDSLARGENRVEDRTSVSLRKVLQKRKTKDMPLAKRGKHEHEDVS